MNFFSRYLMPLGFGCCLLFSCAEHDIPVESQCSSQDQVSYADDVDQIVETNCAISGCHDGTLGANRNWLVFSNFQNHAAEVRRRITLPKDHPDHMPRVGSLTAQEIQTIVCWVDQGAQNN